MNLAVGVQPGHRIAQASDAKAQLRTHFMPVHHKPRRAPLLRTPVKLGGGDLHVVRTFACTGKPEGHDGSRVRGRQRQQAAGMRGGRLLRHGNVAAPLQHQCLTRCHLGSHRPNRSSQRRHSAAPPQIQPDQGHADQHTAGEAGASGAKNEGRQRFKHGLLLPASPAFSGFAEHQPCEIIQIHFDHKPCTAPFLIPHSSTPCCALSR